MCIYIYKHTRTYIHKFVHRSPQDHSLLGDLVDLGLPLGCFEGGGLNVGT